MQRRLSCKFFPSLQKALLTSPQHGVDIEATIKDGNLAVGVFAPTSLLTLEDGKRLVDHLRAQIETL